MGDVGHGAAVRRAVMVMNFLSTRDETERSEGGISSSIRLVEPIDNRPIRYAGPVLPWLIGFAALLVAMMVGLIQLSHIQNG